MFKEPRETQGRAARRATLEELVDELDGMVFRSEPRDPWRMLYVSAGARELTGYAPEDLTGESSVAFGDLLHPADRARVAVLAEAAVRERRSYSMAYRIRHASGGERWVREQGRPVFDDEGTLIEFEGLITDISDLVERESQFQSLFASNPSPILVVDPSSGVIVEGNGAAYAAYGLAPGELVGRRLSGLHSIGPAEVRPLLDEALAGGLARFETKTGAEGDRARHFEAACGPVRLGGRELVYVFMRDITRRVEAEQSLQTAASMQSAIFDASPLALYAVGLDGRVITWNRSAEQIFGWSAEEAIGRMLPIVPEDKLDEYHALRTRSAEGEPLMSRELVRQTKSGQRIVCSISTAPILDPDGRVVAIMGAAEDVSVRKYAENALRESEERFRRIVDHAPDPIFLETRGEFRFVNDRALELFGAKSAADLLGEPVLRVVHPHYRKVGGERLRQLDEEKRAIGPIVDKYCRLDGSEVWVEVTAQPIEFGGESGALFFVRDISQRLAAEQERESLRSQLQQSQRLEAIGRLAGGVAHDFNNLLSVILGNAELIQKDVSPESPLREPIEEIGHAGERAAALTKHLLAFSRKQHLEVRRVDLRGVVRGFDRLLRRVLGEDIALESHHADQAAPVEADVAQLEQVILNIAVNARDAMPDGGVLKIETSLETLDESAAKALSDIPPGEYARLSMRDSGAGMDEETRAMIFEPFFTTKEAGKGTGLGLATTYGIVKQHRGHIFVFSEPGDGARFEIYLPRAAGSLDAADDAQAGVTPSSASSTVLVVEDDPAVRKLAARILEKGGHRPVASSSVEEAITLAGELGEVLDLVLTDVIMPGMKGPDVYAAIRELCPKARVLYMSGYTDNVIEREGLGDEVVAFIQKPFTVNQLLQKIGEVLD